MVILIYSNMEQKITYKEGTKHSLHLRPQSNGVMVVITICNHNSLFYNNRHSQRFILVAYAGALRGHPLQLMLVS